MVMTYEEEAWEGPADEEGSGGSKLTEDGGSRSSATGTSDLTDETEGVCRSCGGLADFADDGVKFWAEAGTGPGAEEAAGCVISIAPERGVLLASNWPHINNSTVLKINLCQCRSVQFAEPIRTGLIYSTFLLKILSLKCTLNTRRTSNLLFPID